MNRSANRPLLLLLTALHLGITAWTWQDLRRRPADRIRGNRALWRLLSGLNTSGSLAYLLLGRRR